MATLPTSTQLREVVTHLIDVCRDGQHGFELAARGVTNEPILRAELLQYSGQRQEFVADLNDALRRAGQPPIQQPTPADEGQRQAGCEDAEFARLRSAVERQDRAAILAECERSEAAAADAYRQTASVSGLPAVLSGTIAVQFHAITRVHDRVQSLIDLATSND